MSVPSPLVLSRSDFDRLTSLIAAADSAVADLLEEEINRASVVAPEEVPADAVAMNSTVAFVDEATGKESTVTLVYPHEANAGTGRVSILAPVGTALIGLRVGQSIRWPMPSGKEKVLKVVSVRADAAASG